MLPPLARLDVPLEAVAQVVQELGDDGVTDLVAQGLNRHSQRADTLARPDSGSAAAVGCTNASRSRNKVVSIAVVRFRPPTLRVRSGGSWVLASSSRSPR